jgi:hypothetical protein
MIDVMEGWRETTRWGVKSPSLEKGGTIVSEFIIFAEIDGGNTCHPEALLLREGSPGNVSE